MSTSRVLDDWLDSYLRLVANTEPPILFHKWVAISTIASCLGRHVYMTFEGELFANMYIVLVAPPGVARKGTAMWRCLKMLRALGVPLAAEATTREALIRALKNSESSIVDPTTGKVRLASALTIFSPELMVFLGYDNKALISDLCDWFDCRDPWKYSTKTQGEDDIPAVWVNLLGATTPELIQLALPAGAIGGGLTSRMIFIYEDKKEKIVSFPIITPEENQLFEQLQRDLDKIYMLRGEFHFNAEWMDLWNEWRTITETRPPFKDVSRLQHYVGRRPVHLLKLCMIMTISRNSDQQLVMTRYDLQRAIDLLEETERKMPLVFGGVGKNKLAEVMYRVQTCIAANKRVPFHKLVEQFRNDASLEDLGHIIATFERMKFARMDIGAGKEPAVVLIE